MIDLIITAGEHSNVKDFIGPRGISFEPVIGKRQVGRPRVVTPDVLSKLEEAFSWGSSDERACSYANISVATLYRYEAENTDFREWKQALKLRPDIKAQKALAANAETFAGAQWWANHRMRDEFATTQKIELDGDLTHQQALTPEVSKAIDEANKLMREAFAAPHKPV